MRRMLVDEFDDEYTTYVDRSSSYDVLGVLWNYSIVYIVYQHEFNIKTV